MTSGVAAVSVVVANLAIQHREAPHTSVAASPLAAGAKSQTSMSAARSGLWLKRDLTSFGTRIG